MVHTHTHTDLALTRARAYTHNSRAHPCRHVVRKRLDPPVPPPPLHPSGPPPRPHPRPRLPRRHRPSNKFPLIRVHSRSFASMQTSCRPGRPMCATRAHLAPVPRPRNPTLRALHPDPRTPDPETRTAGALHLARPTPLHRPYPQLLRRMRADILSLAASRHPAVRGKGGGAGVRGAEPAPTPPPPVSSVAAARLHVAAAGGGRTLLLVRRTPANNQHSHQFSACADGGPSPSPSARLRSHRCSRCNPRAPAILCRRVVNEEGSGFRV